MDMYCAAEPCPVCYLSGKVFALVRKDTAAGLFYCPACGCAWPGGASFDINTDPDDIGKLAPLGVRLPQPHELPPDVAPASPDDVELWGSYIQELLLPRA